MARRHHHNSISLFPFLAVLVCAMGALILLLLVMTRRIRQEQQLEQAAVVTVNVAAITKPDRTAEIQDLELRIRTAQESVATKQAQADALQTIVNERRDRVQSLQQEMDDLKKRLLHDESGNIQSSLAENLKDARQLSAKEAALLRQLKESEKQLLEKQQLLAKATDAAKEAEMILHEKNSALISLRKQVRSEQEKQQTTSGAATLLEFTNSTGTTRTPIVIDVSEKGFEVLPNGITISAADMEGFPVRDNPLLAAIMTTHRYRSKNSVTDEPYVLMLVRPDGCLPFYGAQRILIEAGIHYGYELLEPGHKIVAGEPDPAEPPIVQAAMNEAFRRRENLYAKLMAIAQQREGFPGGPRETQTGSGERRLSMRPDGRIVVDEDNGRRQLDGRFYAGGVAPPASLLQNRPAGGYRGLNPDQLSPNDAEKLANEFAERYAKQLAAAQSAANATAPPNSLTQSALPQSRQAQSGQAQSAQAQDPGTAGSMRSPGEQRFADAVFGSDGSLNFSQMTGAGRSGRTGNEQNQGTGGAAEPAGNPELSATSGVPGMPAVPADQSSFDQLLAGTTASESSFKSQAARPGTTAEDSDWLQSSLLSGDEGSSSSTIGQPKKSKSGTPSKSLLFSGQPDDAPSTGMPDLSRIDADLLRSLQSGRKQSGSMSTPVGIVVFLDEHHLTIGQQPAIAVTQESLDAAFATLLQGIHTETEDARRKPDESLMPIVKFIVSPGGEKWRIPLAHSLKRIGIHTVAIYELTPYITSADRTGRAKLEDHGGP